MYEQIQYLSPSGQTETTSTFRAARNGIVVPVGKDMEVMIPWARVLMYTGPRGRWAAYE